MVRLRLHALGLHGPGVLAALALVVAIVPVNPAQAASPDVGSQLWASRYNGPANDGDYAYALGVSPDGSQVYVTGSTGGYGDSEDYVTIAYAAVSGQKLWTATYDGPAHIGDAAFAIAVSPGGSRVFVTGTSGSDVATVGYDSVNGHQVWAARYNGPGDGEDEGFSIAVSPGGGSIFVTGLSYRSQFQVGYATLAYDAATGRQMWLRRYDGPGNANEALAVHVNPGGGLVYVTGESSIPSEDAYDYATIAYDASTGRQVWRALYDGPAQSDDEARALATSPDGSLLYVTGESIGLGGDNDFATVAYDAATGVQRWVKRYAGPAGDQDYASNIVVAPGGSRVYVTGYSSASNGELDYATLAYDPSSGRQLWAARYNGPGDGNDYAYGLGVSPGGSKVFVTGYSVGSGTGIDYATVAYAAPTGHELWVERYNGPANGDDSAFGLGVSPGGSKVFVVGGSDGGGVSGSDIATVAYHS